MNVDKDLIGIIGQYCSMIAVTAGIVVEILMKAHCGFVFITIGGLMWGVFTKIRGK
jgi:hypothetical protein